MVNYGNYIFNFLYIGMNSVKSEEQTKELMTNCATYQFKSWHLLFPNFDVFNLVCSSNDKTYLFLVAFLRDIILVLLLKLHNDYFDMYKYSEYTKGVLIGYLLVNLAVTIIIMFKEQKIKVN